MQREGIKKNKVVFEAWLAGAAIEVKPENGQWQFIKMPGFIASQEYRVKPETKTVKRWVNIYPSGYGSLWATKAQAKPPRTDYCIACVPVEVTYTEGEGLEDV